LSIPHSQNSREAAFLLAILAGSIVSLGLASQSPTTISSGGSIYYFPFEDEFENGDFSAWQGTYTTVGDTATVTSTTPYKGAFHAHFRTTDAPSSTKYAYCYEDLPRGITEVYARGYFYIADSLPLDDDGDRFGLIGFEVNGRLQSTFRVRRSGGVDKFNVVGYNGNSIVSSDTDAVYPTERQWYCLEFYFKVHSEMGEYKAWVNGIEVISIQNLDTTLHGNSISSVRFGLTFTANVQHLVEVFCDSVVINTSYIGPSNMYAFGVVGIVDENPAIRNLYWLFGNQSIRYKAILPSEVTSLSDINGFDGLVVWTKRGYDYNSTAIKQFAETNVVITHIWDFSHVIYPSLSDGFEVVTTNTVTYVRDWGNFREGDCVEMRNETGDTDQLATVLASSLASFPNATPIACCDVDRVALFHMKGAQPTSGFYVMDLDATTPESEWAGIWHLFPAVKLVQDFPTGKYARWMADGQRWWNLDWVYSYIDSLVNDNINIAEKWVIGRSVEGRDIIAISIGKGSRTIIIDGSIHGNEQTTTFACLRIIELLLENYQSSSQWRSRLDNEWRVIIVPVLNPDGFAVRSRYNANGVDLNSQFPPDRNSTEPEVRTLVCLMGNYTPTVYVNLHTGYYWYPNWLLFGNYELNPWGAWDTTVPAMRIANETFVSLNHWGWFTDNNNHAWIGKVQRIYRGSKKGMAIAYASYQYNASCMLVESFVWTQRYDATQCLWSMDYYCSIVLTFLENNDRLK